MWQQILSTSLLQAGGQRGTCYHYKHRGNEAILLNDAVANTQITFPCKSDFFFFFFLLYPLEKFEILGSEQKGGEDTEISHIPSVPTHT